MAMKLAFVSTALLVILSINSCKKEDKTTDCFPNTSTVRIIDNKKAVVKLTATATEPVYLVAEGSIDTRLIPCNFPLEYYQNDLEVTISGKVKASQQAGLVACCAENFVITKISRL
jgi:hypothetical protein